MMKKQLDDEAQFGKLKTHFTAGNAALEEEKAAKADMSKAAGCGSPALQGESRRVRQSKRWRNISRRWLR